MPAPTTEFNRRDGTDVSTSNAVNNDVLELLFISGSWAEMKPSAAPSWQQVMQEAAETMPDRLAEEFTDRLSLKACQGR